MSDIGFCSIFSCTPEVRPGPSGSCCGFPSAGRCRQAQLSGSRGCVGLGSATVLARGPRARCSGLATGPSWDRVTRELSSHFFSTGGKRRGWGGDTGAREPGRPPLRSAELVPKLKPQRSPGMGVSCAHGEGGDLCLQIGVSSPGPRGRPCLVSQWLFQSRGL